jgi:hypothetical protein
MWLLKKSENKLSSRRQIAIKEVREGLLILPHNEYRMVLETSSVNFELKSAEEQDVLIDTFKGFLNSLPCSLQILVRVREVDVDQYVDQIANSKAHEDIEVYRDQIDNYCHFIKEMVAGNKILSRRFYIVIPYRNTDGDNFQTIKEQLYLTRDLVTKGLEKLGMRAKHLNTLEILDMFYRFYNPSQIKTQELNHKSIKELFTNTYA